MDIDFLASPIIQLSLIIILGILYAVVTVAVYRKRFLAAWDVPFGNWAVARNTRIGYRFFFTITELGSYKVVRIGTALLCIGLIIARDWIALALLVGIFGLTMVTNHFLKLLLPRTRPEFPQNFLYYESFSYPSGHTMLATAFYLMAAYMAWRYFSDPTLRYLAVGVCVALILLIGFSRIYLGVHFLTDVVGGWIAGSLMFWFVLLVGNFLLYNPILRIPI